jgi:hypothetical protein
MKTFLHLGHYLAELFLEWETFQIKFVEESKIHILCPITFFPENRALKDNVEKYYGERETPDDNMAASYMLDN